MLDFISHALAIVFLVLLGVGGVSFLLLWYLAKMWENK